MRMGIAVVISVLISFYVVICLAESIADACHC